MTTPLDGSLTGRDRFSGALLGLAAGSDLGTTLGFRRPGTFTPIELAPDAVESYNSASSNLT